MVGGRNQRVIVNCATCGTPFHPWAGRESTSKVCGLACNGPHAAKKIRNTEDDFESYVSKKDGGCWEWQGPIIWNGYGKFHFSRSRMLAHRYAYLRFKGEIPEGNVVCHSCDNRKCVNPDHLWTGTQADNLRDMWEKGRGDAGVKVHSEAHPLSKITREVALAIRADQRVAREVAADYGVSKSLVLGIKKGTHWKYA